MRGNHAHRLLPLGASRAPLPFAVNDNPGDQRSAAVEAKGVSADVGDLMSGFWAVCLFSALGLIITAFAFAHIKIGELGSILAMAG